MELAEITNMASKDYRRQFLFELSLSAAQANFPAHSRGRCIIGFNVSETDNKIELFNC